MKRDDPRNYGSKCSGCPLAVNGAPSNPVFGVGPVSPLGVVIGESPTREDGEAGRPLLGSAGEALGDALERARLSREKLFILNAVCCAPATKKDRQHLQKAVDACSPVFMYQIEKYAHLPVLALGTWALYAWTGKKRGIQTARGFIRDTPLRKLDHGRTTISADTDEEGSQDSE